jgi:hypothetical protein
MTKRIRVSLMLLAAFGSATSAQVAPLPLTAAQLGAVERGERVVITQNLAGSSWPAVTVYAYVEANPEKAVAVFTDYESHAAYIPDVKRSHIARVIDATTVDVDYVLNVPLVRDEEYTVRDHISRDSAGLIRIDWNLVRASSTKAITGHARFSPHRNSRTGRNGTVIEYHNFVTPGSRIAGIGFIRNRAVGQVEETVKAIARRIEAKR